MVQAARVVRVVPNDGNALKAVQEDLAAPIVMMDRAVLTITTDPTITMALGVLADVARVVLRRSR